MLNFEEPTTGSNVTANGNAAADVSTGAGAGFNYGLIPSIITASGQFLSSIIGTIYQGKAIKAGTYYNRYNQGYNNNYNSGSTSLFLIAGVVVVVVLLKNN